MKRVKSLLTVFALFAAGFAFTGGAGAQDKDKAPEKAAAEAPAKPEEPPAEDAPQEPAAKEPAPTPKRGAYAIYVTNENGGDVSVIDSDSLEVVSTIPVGKRPRGIHAGPLANSVAAEALTSVLIGINRTYKADGAGIRITGIAGS